MNGAVNILGPFFWGLVREVRGELADVGGSEVAVATQNHRAEMTAARWARARAPAAATGMTISFPLRRCRT